MSLGARISVNQTQGMALLPTLCGFTWRVWVSCMGAAHPEGTAHLEGVALPTAFFAFRNTWHPSPQETSLSAMVSSQTSDKANLVWVQI